MVLDEKSSGDAAGQTDNERKTQKCGWVGEGWRVRRLCFRCDAAVGQLEVGLVLQILLPGQQRFVLCTRYLRRLLQLVETGHHVRWQIA